MRQTKVAATTFIKRATRPKKKPLKRAEQRQTKQKALFSMYFVYPMPEKTTELEDVVAFSLTRLISIQKGATALRVHRKMVTEGMRRCRHAVCGSAALLSLWAERCVFCASVAFCIVCSQGKPWQQRDQSRNCKNKSSRSGWMKWRITCCAPQRQKSGTRPKSMCRTPRTAIPHPCPPC